MMEQKKPKFFIRLKDAIFVFDEYKSFINEKLSISIKYFVKYMLLISFIIGIILAFKSIELVKIAKNNIEKNFPDFKIEDNILIIEGENKKFTAGYKEQIGVIVNPETDNIESIEEVNNYQRYILFLKDKIVLKNYNGMKNIITYQDLNQNNTLQNISKQNVLSFLDSNRLKKMYVLIGVVLFLMSFITYSIQILIDIFLLSLIGFILSKIVGMKLEYNKVFSICIYSMSLSILLYAIYIIVNLITGFNIVYFDIAYRTISYIYLVTAILIIKSDLIKQNMELNKIVQVQKQVENEIEINEEEQEDETNKEKKDKENKKQEQEDGQEPQGNQA